jgi:hypothetical protein
VYYLPEICFPHAPNFFHMETYYYITMLMLNFGIFSEIICCYP